MIISRYLPPTDPMEPVTGPFSHLDEARLRELAPHGALRAFAKNTVILNEGDETSSLYVIVSGRVKVYMTGEDGRDLALKDVYGRFVGFLESLHW
jgi:CRP/FNR family cyclic AMP-dependent transcriptional regulator